MAKYPATRFIEKKISQGIITCNKSRLFPDCVTWRGCHTPHYDIAHFTFGMYVNNMHNISGFHWGTRTFANCR